MMTRSGAHGCAHVRGADREWLARWFNLQVTQEKEGDRPIMTTERFLNTYHNATTEPSAEVPADLAGFRLAADPVLAEAAELARILARARLIRERPRS
jgi:hypothetical protein